MRCGRREGLARADPGDLPTLSVNTCEVSPAANGHVRAYGLGLAWLTIRLEYDALRNAADDAAEYATQWIASNVPIDRGRHCPAPETPNRESRKCDK